MTLDRDKGAFGAWKREEWSKTTIVLVDYDGPEDRELSSALDAAAGKPAAWAGSGGSPVRTERGYEYPEQKGGYEAASAAIGRISSGVSRSGLRTRLRGKGLENE